MYTPGDIVLFCFEYVAIAPDGARRIVIRERPAIVLGAKYSVLDLHVFYSAADYPSIAGASAHVLADLSQGSVERGPPAPDGATFWWKPRPGQEPSC